MLQNLIQEFPPLGNVALWWKKTKSSMIFAQYNLKPAYRPKTRRIGDWP